MNFFKNKKNVILLILIIFGFVIVSFIFYNLGSNSTSIKLDNKTYTYDKLIDKINELESKNDKINKEIGKSEKELENVTEEYNEVVGLIEEKNTIEEQLKYINEQIKTKENEINSLNENIKQKEKELASITGQIREKESEPKYLSAGFFTVGKDIPPGRYKVTPNKGYGNFFVNDGSKVNVILGNDSYAVKEYVFVADEGDLIELTTPAIFIPVE